MQFAIAAAAKSLQLGPTLYDPIDGSPPGSPVPGILQERTLEWAAISFSNVWKWKVKGKSLSRVRLLSDPTDCSLLGSSLHGIFQARALEWGASEIQFTHLQNGRDTFMQIGNTTKTCWIKKEMNSCPAWLRITWKPSPWTCFVKRKIFYKYE